LSKCLAETVAAEPGFQIPYLRISLRAYQYQSKQKMVMLVQNLVIQIEAMDDCYSKTRNSNSSNKDTKEALMPNNTFA